MRAEVREEAESGRSPLGWLRHVATGIATFARFAIMRFWHDDGLRAASALTYSSLLALVPLTTITVGILSAFPAFADLREGLQIWLFDMFVPQVGQTVLDYVEGYTTNAGRLTAISVVGLMLTSVLLLATIEDAFNRIWRVRDSRTLVTRFLTFWAILTLAPILVATSFSVSVDLFVSQNSLVPFSYWSPFIGFVPLTLQFVGFTLLYQLIPNRPVRWLDSAVGGAVAAILFDLSKRLFAWYLQEFPAYETIYGALAIIPIFLFWLYIAWSIVLFGAFIAAGLPDWRGGRLIGAHVDDLLSGPRLTIAAAILYELSLAGRLGVGLRRASLAAKVPVGASTLDGMLDQLRTARFIARSASDRWFVSRDLATTTCRDLMRALGIGLRGKIGEIAGLGGPWLRSLQETVSEVESAEASALDRSIARLLHPPAVELIEPAPNRVTGRRQEARPTAVMDGAPAADTKDPAA
jgi:membrane protein